MNFNVVREKVSSLNKQLNTEKLVLQVFFELDDGSHAFAFFIKQDEKFLLRKWFVSLDDVVTYLDGILDYISFRSTLECKDVDEAVEALNEL